MKPPTPATATLTVRSVRLLRRSAVPGLWFAAGFGLFIYLLLPDGVALMNDDFGYVGSVIETLRRHRPWTDDWLEPWSASLAVASAGLWRLTGSVQVAIHGLQAACAAFAAAGIYALFKTRVLSNRAVVAMALLTLTFPTLLWKQTEYTGLVLYLPCLVWALWAVEHRRWWLFLLVWLVALASRQSALAWGVLPVWAAWAGKRSAPPSQSTLKAPIAVAALGAVCFVALGLLMNKTHSQTLITGRLLPELQWSATLHHLAYGFGVWVVFAGLGGLVLGLTGGIQRTAPAAGRLIVFTLVAAAIIAGAALLPRLRFEHESFNDLGGMLYGNALLLAALCTWLLHRFTVRWDYVGASLAALALVGLRHSVWDYYFLDLGLLAFFSVLPHRTPQPAAAAIPTLSVGMGLAVIAALFHAGMAFRLKCRVDRDYAVCRVTEKALRSHAIGLPAIGHAPFGFIGWHLHRHFISHEGRDDPHISGFMRYLQPHATELRFSPFAVRPTARALRPIDGADQSRVLGSDLYRVAWFWYRRCTLLQLAPPGARPPELRLDASYTARPYPLDEAEWKRCLLAAPPR